MKNPLGKAVATGIIGFVGWQCLSKDKKKSIANNVAYLLQATGEAEAEKERQRRQGEFIQALLRWLEEWKARPLEITPTQQRPPYCPSIGRHRRIRYGTHHHLRKMLRGEKSSCLRL